MGSRDRHEGPEGDPDRRFPAGRALAAPNGISTFQHRRAAVRTRLKYSRSSTMPTIEICGEIFSHELLKNQVNFTKKSASRKNLLPSELTLKYFIKN